MATRRRWWKLLGYRKRRVYVQRGKRKQQVKGVREMQPGDPFEVGLILEFKARRWLRSHAGNMVHASE